MGLDEYRDSIGIHRTDKPNVESFKTSDDLMLTYHEDDKDVPLPFTGQMLGWIINHTIADYEEARKGTAAA